jgi:hypothetical protein
VRHFASGRCARRAIANFVQPFCVIGAAVPDDIDDIRRRMERAAEEAVTAVANDLMGRAVEDAPIQEGTLRGSARVDVDRTPSGVEATVSFNTPYSAAVHEGHATQHRNGKTVEWVMRHNPGGGGPKYLEKNLLAMSARYERIIGEAVRQELERP